MIVAYGKSAKQMAMKLKRTGFTVEPGHGAGRYDSFIYKTGARTFEPGPGQRKCFFIK